MISTRITLNSELNRCSDGDVLAGTNEYGSQLKFSKFSKDFNYATKSARRINDGAYSSTEFCV